MSAYVLTVTVFQDPKGYDPVETVLAVTFASSWEEADSKLSHLKTNSDAIYSMDYVPVVDRPNLSCLPRSISCEQSSTSIPRFTAL